MAVSAKSRTKARGKTRRGPSQATQDRQAEVELAVTAIDDEAPDFRAFLARWGQRYSASNLERLWVQAPNATQLHKFPTWFGLGRKVRKGESAIWLKLPRNSHDETRITADNPTGAVFSGASFAAMFDYSQTIAIDDFDETAPDANPDLAAEVKRLRFAATRLHPDMTGRDTAAEFMAAWAAYETARARLTRETP